MTAASVVVASVVIANLMYLVGAAVVAVVLSLAVVLRHRKPKSVEANMATFHRGLRALAPDDRRPARRPESRRTAAGGRPGPSGEGPGPDSQPTSEAETG